MVKAGVLKTLVVVPTLPSPCRPALSMLADFAPATQWPPGPHLRASAPTLPELECSSGQVCLSHPLPLQIFAQMSSVEGAWLFLAFPYGAVAPRPISQPQSSLTLTCLWSASRGRRSAPGEQGLLSLCGDGQCPALRRALAPCVLVGGLTASPLRPGTDLKQIEKLPLAGGDNRSPRASPVPPPSFVRVHFSHRRLAGCACSDLFQEGFERLSFHISLTPWT